VHLCTPLPLASPNHADHNIRPAAAPDLTAQPQRPSLFPTPGRNLRSLRWSASSGDRSSPTGTIREMGFGPDLAANNAERYLTAERGSCPFSRAIRKRAAVRVPPVHPSDGRPFPSFVASARLRGGQPRCAKGCPPGSGDGSSESAPEGQIAETWFFGAGEGRPYPVSTSQTAGMTNLKARRPLRRGGRPAHPCGPLTRGSGIANCAPNRSLPAIKPVRCGLLQLGGRRPGNRRKRSVKFPARGGKFARPRCLIGGVDL
jgi:hypothetical protein